MKKILFVYPSMILGGSTTALLSLLNNLPPDKYEIDLQLLKNEGPLFNEIPKHVNVLPEAEEYSDPRGKFIKLSRFVFSKYFFQSLYRGMFVSKTGIISHDVAGDFKARKLCKKNTNNYDYAISFLEGWSNTYFAYNVTAEKKYA